MAHGALAIGQSKNWKEGFFMGLFHSVNQQDDWKAEVIEEVKETETAAEKRPIVVSETKGTVLGCDQIFEGTLAGKGAVKVEGTLKGNISLNGNVSVSVSGVVEGSIEATNVVVAGTVNGNITAHGRLRLLCSCKVKGDVTVESLNVEDGACLDGRSSMLEKPAASSEAAAESLHVPGELELEADYALRQPED